MKLLQNIFIKLHCACVTSCTTKFYSIARAGSWPVKKQSTVADSSAGTKDNGGDD